MLKTTLGYATALWSLTYGALGIYWATGGSGYPFARVDDDHATASILEGAPVNIVAPAMAVLGLAGAIVAVLMTRRSSSSRRANGGSPRGGGWALEGFAVAMAVLLALVIPDYTPLAMVALSPALLVFAFTGVPGEQDGVGDILYWHRVNILIIFVGGLLWAATAVSYHRRLRHACASCGRDDRPPRAWQTPEGALRWGRRAVLIAVVANLPYELTRVAWYFGWELGITHEFHQMMASPTASCSAGVRSIPAGSGSRRANASHPCSPSSPRRR